jgi:hypothetical protein
VGFRILFDNILKSGYSDQSYRRIILKCILEDCEDGTGSGTPGVSGVEPRVLAEIHI